MSWIIEWFELIGIWIGDSIKNPVKRLSQMSTEYNFKFWNFNVHALAYAPGKWLITQAKVCGIVKGAVKSTNLFHRWQLPAIFFSLFHFLSFGRRYFYWVHDCILSKRPTGSQLTYHRSLILSFARVTFSPHRRRGASILLLLVKVVTLLYYFMPGRKWTTYFSNNLLKFVYRTEEGTQIDSSTTVSTTWIWFDESRSLFQSQVQLCVIYSHNIEPVTFFFSWFDWIDEFQSSNNHKKRRNQKLRVL